MTNIIPIENIVDKIYLIRGQKVMLDSDLADLYKVKIKELNQAVKRNKKRFPLDFMFQLSGNENLSLIPKVAASKKSRGARRKLPYVFTEYGIAMLSSLLNNKIAIDINIMIIRGFTKLRGILSTHKELAIKIAQLEIKYDEQFVSGFNALKHLMKETKKPEIGLSPEF